MRKERGFTLIEVVVVMGILATLMALVTPSIIKYIRDARVLTMQKDIKVIHEEIAKHEMKSRDEQWWLDSGVLTLESEQLIIYDSIKPDGSSNSLNLISHDVLKGITGKLSRGKDPNDFGISLNTSKTEFTGMVVYGPGVKDSTGELQISIED